MPGHPPAARCARKARACTEGKLPSPADRSSATGREAIPIIAWARLERTTVVQPPRAQGTGLHPDGSRLSPVTETHRHSEQSVPKLDPLHSKVSPLFRHNADSGGILSRKRGPRGPGGRRGPGQSPAGRPPERGGAGQRAPRASLTRLRSRAACSRWKSRRAREPGRCLSAQRLMALQKPAGRQREARSLRQPTRDKL